MKKETAADLLKEISKEREALFKAGMIKKQKPLPEISEEEKPYSLPEGWEWVRLGQLCANEDFSFADGPFGSDLKVEHYTSKPEVRLIQLRNIGDGCWKNNGTVYTTYEKADALIRCNAKPGDIVIAKMMPAGKATILPNINDRYILCSDTVKFVPHPLISKSYLLYLTNSLFFRNSVTADLRGTTRQRTSVEKLRFVKIPLPPLLEQKKIVAALDELFAKIDKAKANVERNLANVDELYQSNLNKIFNQNKENWVQSTIGNECSLMTGGTPSKTHQEYFDDGTINWLVSGDIHKKTITDCDGKITELGYENSNAKFLPINSVMIALNGQGKTRGTVALLKIKATCNQSLVSIMPNKPNELLSEYVYENLNARYKELRKLTSDDDSDRRGLNMPILRKITLSYPKDIREQKEIVNNLQQYSQEYNRIKEIYNQKLASLDELKKSLLDKAFRGELI